MLSSEEDEKAYFEPYRGNDSEFTNKNEFVQEFQAMKEKLQAMKEKLQAASTNEKQFEAQVRELQKTIGTLKNVLQSFISDKNKNIIGKTRGNGSNLALREDLQRVWIKYGDFKLKEQVRELKQKAWINENILKSYRRQTATLEEENYSQQILIQYQDAKLKKHKKKTQKSSSSAKNKNRPSK